MGALFVEGGFAMWFLSAFGLATMAFATRFAWAPVRRTLRTTGGLATATVFSSLAGVCVDLATVGHHAPSYRIGHPEASLVEVVLQGAAESLSPAILGFAMLSLAALIVALGFQREVTTEDLAK
jgi:hypothetical protein